MNSLQELNYFGATILDITDQRNSKVIFDRIFPLVPVNQVITVSSTTITPTPGINIEEIIRYELANVRYRVKIVTGNVTPLTGSSISWASLPSGVTLSTVGTTYTLSGIETVAHWEAIKSFTWTLPANYSSFPLWFLEVAILYYDSALGEERVVDWEVYDEDYYHIAYLESSASISVSDSYRVRRPTINISGAFTPTVVCRELHGGFADLVATASLSCAFDVVQISVADMVATASMVINGTRVKIFTFADENYINVPTSAFTSDANTLLLMHMDGINGSTTFTDSSGNNTIYGQGLMSLTTSNRQFGTASAYFDGNNDYLDGSGTNNDLSLYQTDFTIEAWVYTSDDGPILIGYQDYPTNNGWALQLISLNRVAFLNSNGSSGLATLISNTDSVPDNQWTHVVVQYDYSETTIKIFANGVKVAQSTGWYSPDLATVDGLRIGRGYGNASGLFQDSSSYANYYNGYMDEVRISDVVRYPAGNGIKIISSISPSASKTTDTTISLTATSTLTATLSDAPLVYQIRLPSSGSTYYIGELSGYNLVVDWGDGSNSVVGDVGATQVSHSYASSGTKTITISGDLRTLQLGTLNGLAYTKGVSRFNNTLESFSMYTVAEVGSTWVEDEFTYAPTQIPPSITDLSYAFYWCTTFNQDISAWNTGNISDMTAMFRGASAFDQDISSWDVHLIATEPTNFDLSTSASWIEEEKPVWGTYGS